jgi:hypothetical protein
MTVDLWFDSQQGQEIFFSQIQTIFRAHPTPTHLLLGCLSPQIKQLGPEADHSCTCNVEVKDAYYCPIVFMMGCLVKHCDNYFFPVFLNKLVLNNQISCVLGQLPLYQSFYQCFVFVHHHM